MRNSKWIGQCSRLNGKVNEVAHNNNNYTLQCDDDAVDEQKIALLCNQRAFIYSFNSI